MIIIALVNKLPACTLYPLSHVWQHVKLSDVSLGTCPHPQYSLVVDGDVKKPNKQVHCIILATNKRVQILFSIAHASISDQ